VGKGINTIQEKKALPDANKEVGLKVNPEIAKSMLISHYQKAGKAHGTKIVNMSHEYVIHFKYLVIALADQNRIHKEIKSRLN
jgi:hypothetical protein